MEKLAYSISEAAARLGISRAKLYELVKSGELRTFRVGNRRLASDSALRELIRTKELAA